MGSKRRRFSREFKLEALRQVLEEGRPALRVAEELGMAPETLYRWKKEHFADPTQSFPGNGNLKDRDKEVEQLKRENSRLNAENALRVGDSIRSTEPDRPAPPRPPARSRRQPATTPGTSFPHRPPDVHPTPIRRLGRHTSAPDAAGARQSSPPTPTPSASTPGDTCLLPWSPVHVR